MSPRLRTEVQRRDLLALGASAWPCPLTPHRAQGTDARRPSRSWRIDLAREPKLSLD